MGDEHAAVVSADDDGVGLVERYEELRASVVAGRAVPSHGLALLMARGMAAWMAAWRSLGPPARPAIEASAGSIPTGIVAVLASMAVACLDGE